MILVFVLIILFSSTAYADTLLLGHDYYGAPFNDSACYYVGSNSINGANWKGYRIQASTSGTISYFKVTAFNVPDNCTDDDVIWAVYEDDGTISHAGALKAYGYVEGYDWTTIGVGAHMFEVTDIVTDPTIVSGIYYWLVFYAHAIDRDNFSSAGCSSQIFNNRGRETGSCIGGVSSYRYSASPEYPPPPAGRTFETSHNSYFDWSLWEEVRRTRSTTSAPTTTTTTNNQSSMTTTTTIEPATTAVIGNQCPPDYPIDCNNGYCCSMDYPDCGYGIDKSKCFNDSNDDEVLCLFEQLYGENSEPTQVLRYFRDNIFIKSKEGQELIKLYYQWSPFIVRALQQDEELKVEMTEIIDELFLMLKKSAE